jgi:hypothetical protein
LKVIYSTINSALKVLVEIQVSQRLGEDAKLQFNMSK